MQIDLSTIIAGAIALIVGLDNLRVRRQQLQDDSAWDNVRLLNELKDHLNLEDRDNQKLRQEIRDIFAKLKEKGWTDLRDIVENGVDLRKGSAETVHVTTTVHVDGPASSPAVARAVRVATADSQPVRDSSAGSASLPPTQTP